MTSCQQIVTSLVFFQFMANLEQSRSRIPDAQSVKFTFSLTAAFYLTKIENRTKKSLTQLSHYCFELWCHFCKKKNADFLQKDADISKTKRVLVLKVIFSETIYVCVNLRTKFQVSTIIITSFRQGGGGVFPPTSKRASKNPTQIRVKGVLLKLMTLWREG